MSKIVRFLFMNRLFQGITIVMTAIGAVVIISLEAELLKGLAYKKLPGSGNSFGSTMTLAFSYLALIRNTKLMLIASACEVALVWLLVVLNVISQRRGLIATLVLFILSAITVFIVYYSSPLLN